MMDIRQALSRPPTVKAACVLLSLLPLALVLNLYRLTPTDDLPRQPFGHAAHAGDFVSQWLEVHLVDPFFPSAIGAYCNESQWRPNLIFNLENTNGGVASVRGSFLDFILFAIENGASIVLPSISMRSVSGYTSATKVGLNAWFDEEWFLSSMRTACPQMTIYEPWDDQGATKVLTGTYEPRSRRMDQDTELNRANSRKHANAWLEERNYVASELTVVNVARRLWDVDTRSLPKELRRSLSQVLRINPAIGELAAEVAKGIALRLGGRLDPKHAIPRQAFLGAHIPRDPVFSQLDDYQGNSNLTFQAQSAFGQALKAGLEIIYVASGNETDVDAFKRLAVFHQPSFTALSKFDLLDEEGISTLGSLSWDQQSLVDFLVLQRCSLFAGISGSAFSYGVALLRNQWLEDHSRVMKPWFAKHRDENVTFDDGVSRVVGKDEWHEKNIARGMWP